MKASPKILLALIAVAALSVAYPAKANLVTNGGFETGDFTGWTQGGEPWVRRCTRAIHRHQPTFGLFSGLPEPKHWFFS